MIQSSEGIGFFSRRKRQKAFMNTESFESADSRENKYADNADNKAKTEKMFGIIEALLYVSGEPVSIVELQRVFGISAIEMRAKLSQMIDEMRTAGRGMIPYMTQDTVQLVTNSEYNEWVVKLLSPPEERTMSDSLLETLSVIAYRQPVTRADIESVRGVRCEYSVTQLLKQDLIVELGRKNCIGHPMQFGTTDAFLRKFGLRSLGELPPLPIHEEDGERETPQPDSSEATKNPSESTDATGE